MVQGKKAQKGLFPLLSLTLNVIELRNFEYMNEEYLNSECRSFFADGVAFTLQLASFKETFDSFNEGNTQKIIFLSAAKKVS